MWGVRGSSGGVGRGVVSCLVPGGDLDPGLAHGDAHGVSGGSAGRLLGFVLYVAVAAVGPARVPNDLAGLDIAEEAEGGVQGLVVDASAEPVTRRLRCACWWGRRAMAWRRAASTVWWSRWSLG